MSEPRTLLARLFNRRTTEPAVPHGTRVYAIGDVHGRADLLEALLDRIWSDAGRASRHNVLVFLGDYIDRGLQSRQVIARLVTFHRPGWHMVALRGNHDQMLLDFLDDPHVYQSWRDFGAPETLISYGVKPPSFERAELYGEARDTLARALPDSHLDFLRTRPYAHVIGGYVFAHAGLRPGVPLEAQSPKDLMWIRDEFIASERAFDKVVVHGHTPSPRPVVMPNRIGVDTGAYATGCLTAVVLEGSEHTFLST